MLIEMEPTRKTLLVHLIGGGAVSAAAAVLLLWLLAPPSAKSSLCALGVVMWLLLAVLVPFWVRRLGLRHALVLAAVLPAASLVTSLIVPAGRLAPGSTLALHAFLVCFGCFAAGLSRIAAAGLRRQAAGQAAAAAAALVFLGSVLVTGFAEERSPCLRQAVFSAVLWTNPVALCGGTVGYDVMRNERMYRVCPIGSHRFTYPRWYAVCLVYLCAGIAMLVSAEFIDRRGAGEQRTDAEDQ